MNKQLEILPYNPRWVVEFEAEWERIAHVIGDCDRTIASGVQHQTAAFGARLYDAGAGGL